MCPSKSPSFERNQMTIDVPLSRKCPNLIHAKIVYYGLGRFWNTKFLKKPPSLRENPGHISQYLMIGKAKCAIIPSVPAARGQCWRTTRQIQWVYYVKVARLICPTFPAASGDAFFWSRRLATSSLPYLAATCKGVNPFCKRNAFSFHQNLLAGPWHC